MGRDYLFSSMRTCLYIDLSVCPNSDLPCSSRLVPRGATCSGVVSIHPTTKRLVRVRVSVGIMVRTVLVAASMPKPKTTLQVSAAIPRIMVSHSSLVTRVSIL